jgi:transcriptional regulator with XRE-family HTH domain
MATDVVKAAFGLKFKELRKSKFFTQDQIAAILGVQRTTISNYEACRSTPSLEQLWEIAKLFDTQPSDFLPILNKPVTKEKAGTYLNLEPLPQAIAAEPSPQLSPDSEIRARLFTLEQTMNQILAKMA